MKAYLAAAHEGVRPLSYLLALPREVQLPAHVNKPAACYIRKVCFQESYPLAGG